MTCQSDQSYVQNTMTTQLYVIKMTTNELFILLFFTVKFTKLNMSDNTDWKDLTIHGCSYVKPREQIENS